MKNSIIKTLLNYSTSLTKVTNKRLKNAKSPEDKIDLISKQFEDIKKKVSEVVKEDESAESKGESVIKLEFDKLNKRLDVIEATDYTKSNFIMGLLKGDDSESSGKSSDESDDGSLISLLSDLLGGKLDVSDLLSGGLTITKIGRILLGAASHHPYILLGVLGIAATIYAANKIAEIAEDTKETEEATGRGLNGATRSDVEEAFLKHSGGKTYSELIEEIAATDDPERRKELEDKLSEIRKAVVDELAPKIVEEVTDKSTVSQTSAQYTTDRTYLGEYRKKQEDIASTFWDKVKKLLFYDKEKYYSNTLSTMDLSSLGSLNGLSVSANDVIYNLNFDYTSLINETVSEHDYESEYKSFYYYDPLGSIKRIAIEYAKGDGSNINGSDGFNNAYTGAYKMLLAAFIYPIGRTNLPSFNTNELVYENSNTPTPFADWENFRFYSKKSIKDNMPTYKSIIDIYYNGRYKVDSDKDHASKMTIKQQCKLLGVNISHTESLINEDSKKEFYFLPVKVKYTNIGSSIDTGIKQSDRILLNQIGIMRAKRIELGNYGEESFSKILEEQSMSEELREAEKISSNIIGIAPNSMNDYTMDPVVVEIISRNSGIKDANKWNNGEWNDIAKVLQKFDLGEIDKIITFHEHTANYEELVNTLEKSGSKNAKDAARRILERLSAHITSDINYNKDDIIESYNYHWQYTDPTQLDYKKEKTLDSNKFNEIMNKISTDAELRKKYNKARNEVNGDLYWELYEELGLGTKKEDKDLGPMRTDKVKELIDRIFRYYSLYMLHDEEDTDSIDLDNAVATYMNIPYDAFITEDISSNTNLFGIGTIDTLKEKLNLDDNDILQFLSEMSKKDLAILDSDENGLPILKYIQAGIDNNSNVVKNALIEVFKSMGIEEDTISKLLNGVSTISEGQAELTEALAEGQGSEALSQNSNESIGDNSTDHQTEY